MEWVKAPHCQKLWTTWSLINVRIHSLTWIPQRKMLFRQEILLSDSWLVAMTMIPWQLSTTKHSKLKFWKEMCWLRQRLSLQLVGQQSNIPSRITIRSWLGQGLTFHQTSMVSAYWMGNTVPFTPNFLLLQMPSWNHSFVITRLIATQVDALAGSKLCHACVVIFGGLFIYLQLFRGTISWRLWRA